MADAVIEAVTSSPHEGAPVRRTPTETIDVGITGMSCASCVSRVENAIRAVPGVAGASVNLATEKAQVAFTGGASPNVGGVLRAIRAAGYEATSATTELPI